MQKEFKDLPLDDRKPYEFSYDVRSIAWITTITTFAILFKLIDSPNAVIGAWMVISTVLMVFDLRRLRRLYLE
jgi:hypothetical protein